MMGKRVSLAMALALVVAVLVAQLAGATHPRPRGATPLHASLVPAYKQCTSPNTTHGAPLSFQSCKPPVQESNYLTVGTPDANGAPANSIGFERIKVGPASDYGEVKVTASVTDVRCRPGTDASVCSSANATDGPDYSGQVEFNATIRISDHYNGENLDEAATVQDIIFPVTAFCGATSDTSTGGVCSATVGDYCPFPFPPGCSIAGRRTVVEFGQIYVTDGGPDGYVGDSNNTIFMRQGVFIP
jgi:hypothetical protein